jgi:hypothetical protein
MYIYGGAQYESTHVLVGHTYRSIYITRDFFFLGLLQRQRQALQEAVQLRSMVAADSSYDPLEGFQICFDIAQPLPRGTQQAQVRREQSCV